MQLLHENKRVIFIVNFVFLALWAIIGYFFVKYVFIWILPFIAAILIVMAVEPLVKLMTNRLHIPRVVASPVCVVILLAIVGAALYFISALLIREVVGLTQLITDSSDAINVFLINVFAVAKDYLESLPLDISADTLIQNIVSNLVGIAGNMAKNIGSSVSKAALQIPSAFIFVAITLVASFFIGLDYNRIRTFLFAQFPEKYKKSVLDIKTFLTSTIAKLVKSYLIITSVTFVITLISFLIMRNKYAVALAVLMGVLEILPIVGTGGVFLPWALVCFITGKVPTGIILLVTWGIAVAARQILEPRIIGKNVGLHPVITLICIYVGFRMAGLLGMLLLLITVLILKNMQETGKIHIWKESAETEKKPLKPKKKI